MAYQVEILRSAQKQLPKIAPPKNKTALLTPYATCQKIPGPTVVKNLLHDQPGGSVLVPIV